MTGHGYAWEKLGLWSAFILSWDSNKPANKIAIKIYLPTWFTFKDLQWSFFLILIIYILRIELGFCNLAMNISR